MTSVSSSSAASNFHVPFPQDLGVECDKSKAIVLEFSKTFAGFSLANPTANTVPPQAFLAAKGLVIMSVIKAGVGWSGRIGSGIVLAKLPDGRWSAPSSVVLVGAGYGPQIGAQITDLIYVLTSDAALTSFTQTGQLSLGAQFSLAAPGASKSMETSAVLTNPGHAQPSASASSSQQPHQLTLPNATTLAPGFCYAKSKGLFIGVSLEGAIISTRKDANEKFYKEKGLAPSQLLSSALEPQGPATGLYSALDIAAAAAQEAINRAGFPAEVVEHSKPPVISAYDTKTAYNVPIQDGSSSSAAPAVPASPQLKAGLYPTANDNAPALPPSASDPPIGIALYDYEAQRPTDISFRRGDVIAVLERSESTNAWWVGRTADGRVGRFPANRIKFESH